MSDSDNMHRRLERLGRLRKLGLRRGTNGLASTQPRSGPGQEPGARGQAQRASNARIALGEAPIESDSGSHRPASPQVMPPRATGEEPDRRTGWASAELPGEPVETPFGPAWVRITRYPLAQHPELAEWLCVSPVAAVALDRGDSLWRIDPAAVAFIDTETTGLSLGAGTYTFLIGVGTYDLSAGTRLPDEPGSQDGSFVVQQVFMRNPAEERAQLHLVEQALGRCSGIVSFNGRGFDMPLITNRFVLAQMPPPLPGAPHLDLLPPARRFWRARWGSCSLGSLERNVLGLVRTADDVPGYLIPDIYRHYYRTEVVTDMLVRVFYHNLQDIISMPLLAARMARPFQQDGGARARVLGGLHPLECLSLGRCYAALAWTEASIEAYQAALSGPLAAPERGQVLRELGYLYKRLRQQDRAAALWEEWIGTLPGEDLTPYLELAKYHEWHTADLDAARGWAAWALRMAESASTGHGRDALLSGLQHRLARLERKLAGARVDLANSEDR